MKNNLELYKCSICGQIVEVVLVGQGTLVCCNKNMDLMVANTIEASAEKHLPVVEIKGEEKVVRVGSIPHPMEEHHYIQFIEAISNDKKTLVRKYLFPNEDPLMKFKCECSDGIAVRELCNIHGLWSSE